MKKMNLLLAFLMLGSPNILAAKAVGSDDCSTKKIQVMKPEFPPAAISGYAVVHFEIKEDGTTRNITAGESMCVRVNRKNRSTKIKECGIFKRYAVNAAHFLKYAPPQKKDGGACTLKNSHRYTFFHEDSEIIVDALKQHFSSLEDHAAVI